jgi:hypothetical protein
MDRIYSKMTMTSEQRSDWRWRRGLTIAESASMLGISVRSFYGYLAAIMERCRQKHPMARHMLPLYRCRHDRETDG